MEALMLLVANAGEVVEKKRLMQTIWPHTIVEDNNLNQCILAIRKALGETAGSNRFVMTVPGRGFCFVCPVKKKIQESDEPEAPPPAAPARPRGTAPHRLAPGLELTRQRPFWYGVAAGFGLAALLLLPLALH
jgi:DNA-binding winged helix-turn-helix (wHTH) protein